MQYSKSKIRYKVVVTRQELEEINKDCPDPTTNYDLWIIIMLDAKINRFELYMTKKQFKKFKKRWSVEEWKYLKTSRLL